ncbi:MAG TPA: M12 family metallopeptidase [Stellaceae bacterium]|jgi:hypothetical protein|nr:M12 family metallopeptidase [Stellaceae bacterium]
MRVGLAMAAFALAAALSAPSASAENGQPEIRTGIFRGQPVTYQVIDGKKIFQGDIILDHVTDRPAGASPPPGGAVTNTIAIAYPQYFWPKVGSVAQIPYIVTNAATNLSTALSQFNSDFTGVIQFVPRGSEADYVNFDFSSTDHTGTCESNVGRIGGEQDTGGSIDCSLGTLLHEFGHIVGLYHEQSRPDRSKYVTINYANVIKGSLDNFAIITDNFQDTGLYDYASIMHYIAFAFTRNGGPVIESIPAGIPLSNQTNYTAADLDTVMRLYGAAPTAVTIASNPPGLQVTVDGATVTTPQSFNWKLNSKHTLAVPSTPQTLNGDTYTYGRWNDNTVASHSIQIKPGIGTLANPATSPDVTVYTANFIELVPYNGTVSPTGAGTLTPSPAPLTYSGIGGSYYIERQAVTLTPAANTGFGFLEWGNIPGPWSSNPKPDYIPEGQFTSGALSYSPIAYFSTKPITTITTNPPGHWIWVDGNFWYGPQNFASDYFPSWTPGSSHQLSINQNPQEPYSVNSRFTFDNWSDGGAITHNINVPSGASTITATFTPDFVPIAFAEPSCAAGVTITPPSPTGDGFYPEGSVVTIAATPSSGWILTGWLDDLKGKNASQKLTIKDEELAVANYNTTATALAVTALSPATIVAGTNGHTLEIKGKGFDASPSEPSIVFVNNAFRASTVDSAGEITVDLTASDLATPTAFPVAVSDFPSGAPCAAFAPHPFFVTIPK